VPNFIPTAHKALPNPGQTHFSFTIIAPHPFSRGSVHIGSSDPLSAPVIDLALGKNPVDVEILVGGIKFARKLCETEALRSVIVEEISPGIEVQSDEALKEYIKNVVNVTHHPLGSAAMTPREEGGVVDSGLKVYGTKNIRVVRTYSLRLLRAICIPDSCSSLAGRCIGDSDPDCRSSPGDCVCYCREGPLTPVPVRQLTGGILTGLLILGSRHYQRKQGIDRLTTATSKQI
jgi:hypothetical protein